MLWPWTNGGRKYRASADRCQLLLALDRGAQAIDTGTASAITRPSRTRSPFKAPRDEPFLASSRRTRRPVVTRPKGAHPVHHAHFPDQLPGLFRRPRAPVDPQPPHRPWRGHSLCDASERDAYAVERFGLWTTGTRYVFRCLQPRTDFSWDDNAKLTWSH